MFESARNRYLAVGIAVYLLELIVIGLCQFSGLSALVAISIGFWVGIVASFLLQKIVAFEDTRSHNKIIIAQVVAYGMLVVLNYTFTLLLT